MKNILLGLFLFVLSFSLGASGAGDSKPRPALFTSCKVSANGPDQVKKLLSEQRDWLVKGDSFVRVKLFTNNWKEFKDSRTKTPKGDGPQGKFFDIPGWDCDRAVVTIGWSDNWEAGSNFLIDLYTGAEVPTGLWSPNKDYLFAYDVANSFGGSSFAVVYLFGKKRDGNPPKEIWNMKRFKLEPKKIAGALLNFDFKSLGASSAMDHA